MVTIRDASYIFQSILVKANILAYFSFFEKISPIKRLCPFKWILSVDLFTFSKNLTMAILRFRDNIVLIRIYRNVFMTCIHISICELLIYYFK